jgi:23S rRNA pseudouridine1911/1915/1917 synthase
MSNFVFPPGSAGARLDRALADHIPELSRMRLQALIADGCVVLDGRIETSPSRKLRGGEAVCVTLPPLQPATPVAEAIPLTIAYEDEDVVVVDKAAGMVVHPSNGHERGTLVHALLAHCGNSLSGINGVMRPGIVHRLDKDTSGLLVVAKHDRAHRHLAAQFADHGRTGALERQYRALIWGEMPRAAGTVEAAITRSTHNREKMIVSRAERARFAITHYAVEAAFAQPGKGGVIASEITCQLETGRTHQIRVHMAHLGHPLLGDALYGSGFRTREAHLPPPVLSALKALGRQALHAELLAFEHPRTREILRFSSNPPLEFEALVNAFMQM